MKLSIILFFVSLTQLMATEAYAQLTKLTLQLKDATVREVLNQIQESSEFFFLYNSKLVDVDRTVSGKFEDQKIDEILNNIFQGTDVVYFVVDQQIVLTNKTDQNKFTEVINQQQKLVSGKVTDKSGALLSGVSVIVKGTTYGTVTDNNGNFSLELPANAETLSFSFIGMNPVEIKIDNQEIFNVTLEESVLSLEEVLITAYGTSKRKAITGSITSIKQNTIEKIAATNITTGLQGLSPGLQVFNESGRPGANQVVMIRGIGSMTGGQGGQNAEPLYVVDGVPYDLPLNTLNYYDIESISVLKDAASSALYGSRAGNGVIIITTKQGREGKTKINFHALWGTSEQAVPFQQHVPVEKQWELTFEGLYNDAFDFGGKSDTEAREWAYNRVSSVYYQERPFTLPDGTVRNYASGWNTDYPVGLDGKIKPDAKRLWNYNLFDEVFSHKLKQEYSLDISGASTNNRYYVSMSSLDDRGMFIGDGFKRTTGKFVLDSKLTKWLDISNNVVCTNTNNQNISVDLRFLRNYSNEYTPFLWDYSNNDYYISQYSGKRIFDLGILHGTRGTQPFPDLTNIKKEDITNGLKTNTILTAHILDALILRSTYSIQVMHNNFYRWQSPERELEIYPNRGSVERNAAMSTSQYVNNILSYTKTFANKHNIDVMVGQEYSSYFFRNSNTSRTGLSIYGFSELGQATNNATVSSGETRYVLNGLLSKLAYNYQDKYFISGSYRRDASSRFSPKNRWGNFYSFGVAWDISQEKFMRSIKNWLNYLKPKFSYGEVGNDNVGDYYPYHDLYLTGVNYYGQSGVIQKQLENTDLKWEINVQTNVGIDFAVFNKLSGSFELFNRKSKDLIMNAPIAPSIGAPTSNPEYTQLTNIGDMKNVGWELDLNYTVKQTINFEWSINTNATHYINKITALSGIIEARLFDYYPYVKWQVGGSRFDLYMPRWAGINPDNGLDQWWKYTYDANGKIIEQQKTEIYSEVNNSLQRQRIGSPIPDVFGSITNNLRYKNIDLSFMFFYSLGGYLYDYNRGEGSITRRHFGYFPIIDERWTNPGDITTVAKIYIDKAGVVNSANLNLMTAVNSKWMDKNNFARLKNLVIGYTLPKSLLLKIKTEYIRIYFKSENLLTFAKYTDQGSDPENGGFLGVAGNFNAIPPARTYNFGIDVSF